MSFFEKIFWMNFEFFLLNLRFACLNFSYFSFKIQVVCGSIWISYSMLHYCCSNLCSQGGQLRSKSNDTSTFTMCGHQKIANDCSPQQHQTYTWQSVGFFSSWVQRRFCLWFYELNSLTGWEEGGVVEQEETAISGLWPPATDDGRCKQAGKALLGPQDAMTRRTHPKCRPTPALSWLMHSRCMVPEGGQLSVG